MNKDINLEGKISGWGADLDLKNRPAVPMAKKPEHGTGAHWTEPEQQVPKVHIHHSIERPGITPVFGSTVPPKGLSGLMRNFAYRYSEAQLIHWLTLLAADRVDMIEGILDDLRHGHIPNIYKEMGLKSELRAPRFRKTVTLASGAILGFVVLRALAKRSRSQMAST